MTSFNDSVQIRHWKVKEKTLGLALGSSLGALSASEELFSDQAIQWGQFAGFREISPGSFEAIRDPLGIGKLFYTQIGQKLQFSRSFVDLLGSSSPIYSVPRGCHVRLGALGERVLLRRMTQDASSLQTIQDYQGTPAAFMESAAGQLFADTLRARLDQVFAVIRDLEEAGNTVFIALSGGLDSSVIASLAHRHLRRPIAVTLDLGRSEDAEKSALIAGELSIRHVVFQTSQEEILETVNEAPLLCQDFRDFNVHCAALNILLARNIVRFAEETGLDAKKLVVLTGDLMNEYTNDYAEEVIEGHRYYRLPRVDAKQLQEHLIGGLDTSDREALPFAHYGIRCIQPYSMVFDVYAAVPQAVLELKDVKKVLNSFLVAPQIMEYLPKSKLRAQVGSKESMGVLGLCHAMKIDESAFLRQILSTSGATKERVPIFMGRYQTEEFGSTDSALK